MPEMTWIILVLCVTNRFIVFRKLIMKTEETNSELVDENQWS